MANLISVMQRYELKYLLTPEQGEYFISAMSQRMKLDQYGLTQIASLYYDRPDYFLIRNSIDADNYKEKIRLRSYGLAKENSPVFLELKRKANGIVYKRRVQTTLADVENFFTFKSDIESASEPQIAREINYFRNHYESLEPAALIIYDRRAYYEVDGDLRLTIDANPRFRLDNLNLTYSMDGESLLPSGWLIMEIKVQQAMPMWLTKMLSDGKIYKNSFSKYGEVYKSVISKGVKLNVENL